MVEKGWGKVWVDADLDALTIGLFQSCLPSPITPKNGAMGEELKKSKSIGLAIEK